MEIKRTKDNMLFAEVSGEDFELVKLGELNAKQLNGFVEKLTNLAEYETKIEEAKSLLKVSKKTKERKPRKVVDNSNEATVAEPEVSVGGPEVYTPIPNYPIDLLGN